MLYFWRNGGPNRSADEPLVRLRVPEQRFWTRGAGEWILGQQEAHRNATYLLNLRGCRAKEKSNQSQALADRIERPRHRNRCNQPKAVRGERFGRAGDDIWAIGEAFLDLQ